MAMTYSSLVAAKGTAGSLANFVNYSKLDTVPILDEAQALLYSLMRVREMRTQYLFSLAVGQAHVALPSNFLDPIGRIRLPTLSCDLRHKDQSFVKNARNYTPQSGSLGASPFTTVNGSVTVNVALTGHGFSQDSLFTSAGATALNGVTINGIFPVSAVVDANTFSIDITALGAVPNAGSSGGGSAVTYSCDNIVQGVPIWFGIWDETIYFDQAINQASSGILHYYRSLALLSSGNQSNFLTNRYPHLLRTACQTAAADFMKDDGEYQKGLTRLTALVSSINAENDGSMRGMEIDPENP